LFFGTRRAARFVPTFKLKESFLAARGEFLPDPEAVKDLKK
jgi:hypothetical protein